MTRVVLINCIVELTIDIEKLPEPLNLLRCVATLMCLWRLEAYIMTLLLTERWTKPLSLDRWRFVL